MDTKILEEIGLTNSEIQVYLALLELGSSSTGKIVDKSKVASSKIYEILDKLMQKGLASFIIKNGVKYFEAAPPERIMDYMKEKEEKFKDQKTALGKMLPQLELRQKMSRHKTEATIFKGLKGCETAFKHMINSMQKDDEWIGFIVSSENENYFNLLTKLHRHRAENGLSSRIIFNEKSREQGKKRESIPKTTIKYMPDDLELPAVVNVAGDIALLSVIGEEITVFMIENKEVANSFRSQFERLWNQEVIVSRGTHGAENAWDKMLDELGPGEEYYAMGVAWRGQKEKMFDWYLDFHKRRIRKKVRAKFLFVSGTEKNVEKYGEYYRTLSEVKFLPQGVYEGMQINLYKNKVLIFVWREKEPVIFTIEDKQVYQTFKTYFDALWGK